MKDIISWEFKQRRNYLLWWTVAITGLIVLILMLYPSIRKEADQLNQVLNQLPASLRELRTGGSSVDVASPSGFLNSQLYYVTLPLMFIIMAIGLGSSLLARDEQSHTLELLLARPISRTKVLVAKGLSGLAMLSVVTFVTTSVTVILAKVVDLKISTAYLILTAIGCSLFCASFGIIAYALTAASALTKRTSVSIAVFFSFGGYLLASLSSISSYIEFPAKLLPYHYFSPVDMLKGHISKGFAFYMLAIYIIAPLVAWVGFRRRDLN